MVLNPFKRKLTAVVPPRIFISYSRDDYEYAEFLRLELRNRGIDIFLDTHSLQGGDNFYEIIPAEIKRCDVVVALLSANTVCSKWVPKELEFAHTWRKKIIPIILESFADFPDSIKFLVNSNQQIPYEQSEAFIKRLCQILGWGGSAYRMPQPFEWCEIPAGRIIVDNNESIMLEDKEFRILPFMMAKYAVTNGQFQQFIESGGYENHQWWTKSGWEMKELKQWSQPRVWPDKRNEIDDHPVAGVSWFEALAFCHWLSLETGEFIRLPTEYEWQWAAQGGDNRDYPWGNEFDVTRCNTVEGGLGQTTAVTKYPNGSSPFGVMDMSGNVSEWCLNSQSSRYVFYDIENGIARALRGGHWSLDKTVARVTFAGGGNRHNGNPERGFRLARFDNNVDFWQAHINQLNVESRQKYDAFMP